MLDVINLHKSYGQTQVLQGVNFKVHSGETVIIMGPSGCGKSTTIRCINRLTEPDLGEIIYKGENLLELSDEQLLQRRQDIGFVFQNFNLIDRLTVLDNIMLALLNQQLSRADKEKRAQKSLDQVQLGELYSRYPQDLSGGQKQRVAIARALALQPDLMLLDEPTASLDPILVSEVLEVLEQITATTEMTLIIVTHELEFAYRVADRILLMEEGVVVEEGSPEQILSNPISKLGQKYSNLFRGE
ncbi:MAG: amino acid ABC transporter ATP-binding protein [Bacillota bacterium]